jgi:signal transduction histidine kinase
VKQREKLLILAATIILVTSVHYGAPRYLSFLHEFLARFYYIPIILSGLWFGAVGGLVASLAVTFVYLPHVWMVWSGEKGILVSKLLEVSLFNLAGPLAGLLSDRARRQRAENEELQTLAAVGEGAASVAHEIKNVLIPLRGFLRRIREHCPVEGPADSYLRIVERESARLEEMTRSLLSFARQAPLTRQEVDPGAFLEELRETISLDFHDRGIHLVCTQHDCKGPLLVDRERVRLAVVNVLQNALHASQEGGEVRLQFHQDRDAFRVVVEDEGAGIPEEYQSRLFRPFFTTKSKGTGLGLAITMRVVKEHGGDITVESSRGKGTRVALRFPNARRKG